MNANATRKLPLSACIRLALLNGFVRLLARALAPMPKPAMAPAARPTRRGGQVIDGECYRIPRIDEPNRW